MELIASDGKKGAKEDTGRWSRDIMVEERRRWGYILTWVEHVLNGSSGGVEVGLVGETYFRPGGEATEEKMVVSVLAG